MKKVLTAVLSASAVFVFHAAAVFGEESYRAEVSANYSQTNDDAGDMTLYGLMGQVYFEPVKTGEHPYAEAAFLERVGSVSVLAANVEQKINSLSTKMQGPAYGLDLLFAKPGFPLTFEASYIREDLDLKERYSGSLKIDEYDLKLGYYITNTLHAGVEYAFGKQELSSPSLNAPDIELHNYGLFAKYVHELGQGREISVEGAVRQINEDEDTKTLTNTEVELLADYFPTQSLSFGVSAANESGDNKSSTGTTFGANLRYFFTPRISAKIAYSHFENSSSEGSRSDETQLMAAVRF